MSNPTELPDLDAEKANFEDWAGVKYRNVDAYTVLDHDRGWQAWRERARRAKPEGEAPQAEKVSCPLCSGTGGVMMDGDCSDCKGKGFVWEPAATLSPLCGAQHAESGKEAWTDERIEELFKAKGGRWQSGDEGGFWIVEDADLHPFVRTILAQQAAAQGTVTDYGTSAPGTPEAPKGGA